MYQVGARTATKKWRYYATGSSKEGLFSLITELLENPDITKVTIERKYEVEKNV